MVSVFILSECLNVMWVRCRMSKQMVFYNFISSKKVTLKHGTHIIYYLSEAISSLNCFYKSNDNREKEWIEGCTSCAQCTHIKEVSDMCSDVLRSKWSDLPYDIL